MITYLQVESLGKSFGERELFRDISFSVAENQRVGLIARNGTGKSTLMEIIAGRQQSDEGEVVFRRDLKVGYLEQNPTFRPGQTVLEACFREENETVRAIARYERALTGDDPGAMQEAISDMDRLKAWDYEQRCKQILSRLRIENFSQPVESLSGGQIKRVALAGVLIGEPDLLLLDEPTNHLDLEMTGWLEEYLSRSKTSLLMVTHDRYFLDRVCSDIVEIDGGKVYTYKGNYSYYLEKRQERIDAAASQLDKDRNIYRRELEWMRRQPQARAGKAQYRIDAFHDLKERVQGGRNEGNVRIEVKSSYIGKKIFEIKDLCKSFGEVRILDRFSYAFARYEKLGIIGENGTGKSTFIKMLMGLVKPDSGTIDIGQTVRFGYYSQEGLEFDDSMKVIDVVTRIADEITLSGGRRLSASQFLQHFLFPPEVQYNYVAKLSGGERRRLYLCTVLIGNPNFLILDEPTNDLDIMTLNILEEYLQGFDGCVMVVSHDRYFMDKVADHLLVFRGGGQIKDFPGNYSRYLEWKTAREAEEKALQTERHTADRQEQPSRHTTAPSPGRRRMTFKEKREFEALGEEIPRLEAEKATLEERISSGTLGIEELNADSTRIGELIGLIDEKSMRWLELSEIEG